MYDGTAGTRGTGRTSTVITSTHSSVSRASTRWSKDFFEGGAGAGGGAGGGGAGAGWSLKRWSQLSHHRRASSGVSALSQQQQQQQQQQGPPETQPPPGRILTTEVVSVEYEKNDAWIGKAF